MKKINAMVEREATRDKKRKFLNDENIYPKKLCYQKLYKVIIVF